MNGDENARTVQIGLASSKLRRTLGPTSWMVLEEMLIRSSGIGDDCVAHVSVRALAASLGLAKNTIALAIHRLRDAGLVTALQQRASTGTFDTGTYTITPCADTLVVTSPPAAGRQPRARAAATQLALLPPD